MPEHSTDHLVRYLLGDLTPDETERLDERSVTDGEFSLRLREIENDMVDRYARGEPFDAALQGLDRVSRTSPYLKHKIGFARALSPRLATGERTVARAPSATSNRFVRWVAVAAMAAITVGYLSVRNVRLREALTTVEAGRVATERANAELRQQLERVRSTPVLPAPLIATFQLTPPRRDVRTETIMTIPRAATEVRLQLQVELDVPNVFWAALRDPGAGRIVWRSGDVTAEAASPGNSLVVVTIPASVLAPRRYVIDLSRIDRSGSAELIGQYAIRAVLE